MIDRLAGRAHGAFSLLEPDSGAAGQRGIADGVQQQGC